MEDDLLAKIGRKYEKSPAQVTLRWVVQHDGIITIPKSTSRRHLADNIDVFDFSLTDSEMRAIARPSLLRTVSLLARSRLPF